MLSHLLELRQRIISTIATFVIFFCIFFFCSSWLLQQIMLPLIHSLPIKSNLIATNITAPIFIPLQIAFNASILSVIPVFLYQLWRFVAPGLFQNERKLFIVICCFSYVLCIFGMSFCFYFVLPWMFKLINYSLPISVTLMPDIEITCDFIIHMLVVFSLCFQVPIICFLLVKMNFVSYAKLIDLRPYVIVLAFVIGMLLTPPDVVSQILLAIPLWLLFEIGLLLIRFCFR